MILTWGNEYNDIIVSQCHKIGKYIDSFIQFCSIYFETNIAKLNSGSSILLIVKDSTLLTGATSTAK